MCYPIRRSGTLSVLDFTLSRPAADPGEDTENAPAEHHFDDRNSTTGDRSPYSVDGVKLIDTKNRKAYLVASESGGRCLCSTGVNVISVETGETYSFYATFAAPPAAVTDLEVNVPRFGAIPRVPVHVGACAVTARGRPARRPLVWAAHADPRRSDAPRYGTSALRSSTSSCPPPTSAAAPGPPNANDAST